MLQDPITKARVLVVEDSILTAEHLVDLIGSVRHAVVVSTVSSEHEALAAIEEVSPDIVVLDLRLKDGNGFNVLRQIGTKDRKPHIIVLTNFALPNFRECRLHELMSTE